MDTSNISEFDGIEWQKAYVNAGLNQETRQLKTLVEEINLVSGLNGVVMTAEQAVDHWQAMEENQLNLIQAELGDDTVVKLVGEKGEDTWDISGNIHSWEVLLNKVAAYKEKGDYESLQMALSLFPDGSAIKNQLSARADQTIDDGGKYYKEGGYDPTIGKLTEAVRGNQYDLLTGMIDFRTCVRENALDVQSLATQLVLKFSGLETIYAEDWEELNKTLRNVQKKFGEKVREELWLEFEKKYRADPKLSKN